MDTLNQSEDKSVSKSTAVTVVLEQDSEKTSDSGSHTVLTSDERHRMIATAAYYRAQHRGFIGADPVEDWLAAEAEIDALPTNG